MRAVIYARYSAGPHQTEQSIDGQVTVCTEFCKQRGLTVQEVYADRHLSGKTDNRPEFQRLIRDAKAKKFEAVVVYKTDRFARNKYDSAIYKRELRQAGVQLLYAAEAIPEGPEGIILESLMEGLAEYYSAELAQKIKRGIHESAVKGRVIGNSVPLGYRTSSDHTYEIDPETAPVIKKIFEMYVDGVSCSDICRYLTEHGFRTRRGQPFNHNSINRILNNKKYMGVYEAAGVVYQDKIEPIVSQETFLLAKREMQRRRKGKATRADTADYLLAGKLFCGHCGSLMHGVSGTSKTGNTHYYYTCAKKRKKLCDKKSVAKDYIEQLVVDLTMEYILEENRLRSIAEKMFALQEESDTTQEEIRHYKKMLRENSTASDNILKAVEKGLATDTLLTRLKTLEDERAAILGEIAFLESRTFGLTVEELEFFLLQFLQRDDEEDYNRRIIKSFISRVVLYDDKIEIEYTLDGQSSQVPMCSTSDSSSPLSKAHVEHIDDAALIILSAGFALRVPFLAQTAF